MLNTSRGVDNFIGFLVTGVFIFHFMSACISAGSKSITGNQGVITSLQFPRALLPIATVLSELFTLLPALLVLLVIVPVTGEPITARSEEHTSELQSLMRISYAVFCLKKK